jgi:beta-glucosidase
MPQKAPSSPVELRSIRPNSFPANFVWGVATSSFQIEGATLEDGRGMSIWDEFCKQPGTIADGSHGDVACDHYHRLEEDLDLIAGLGVNAYRFSVAWSRVQPDGDGRWNSKGLDFYERMVDGLLDRGIKPYLTLNHWDLPQALQLKGGWANRDTTERFVDYALGIHHRLGSRLAAIVTHNEPWVIAVLGHESGIFAPGIKNRAMAAQVSHHLLLSHGLALRALREVGCTVPLGIVLNLAPVIPASDSIADKALAKLEDGKLLRWYMDPLFKGHYPQDVFRHLGEDAPKTIEGDMEIITTPMDFMGVNYYSRSVASAGKPFDVHSSGLPITDMDWEVYPRGLTDLLVRMNQDYRLPPIYITENGGAFKDKLVDGQIHDADRTSYLAAHIGAVADAIMQGVPMQGYMVWSLLDNFEWASGYAKRFGIVHVDYATQKRTLKDSALWYRQFLARESVVRPLTVASEV